MFLPGRDKRVLLQESATIEPQGFRIKLDSRLDEKLRLQAAQKDSEARRLSATKHMSLFQQPEQQPAQVDTKPSHRIVSARNATKAYLPCGACLSLRRRSGRLAGILASRPVPAKTFSYRRDDHRDLRSPHPRRNPSPPRLSHIASSVARILARRVARSWAWDNHRPVSL